MAPTLQLPPGADEVAHLCVDFSNLSCALRAWVSSMPLAIHWRGAGEPIAVASLPR